MDKIVIYQVFTRLFGNRNISRIENGSVADNGTGKFDDFDIKTLRRIHQLGATHVWFTGVIRHASCTDYSAHGIPTQHPAVVKGKAGSPYAICDYYDVDPDLAVNIDNRMKEWEQLIERTHKAGMKVVMDFVPNHVARQYESIAKPEGVEDLGKSDNRQMHFSTDNNFYYCVGEDFTSPCPSDYKESPAKATGNDCFSAHPSINDWYETVKLNYGIDYNDWSGTPSEHFSPIPSTWKKMTDILLYWAAKNVDAFRCDMAEMVPSAFWHYASGILKKAYPHIKLIGEVYNPAQYRNYIAAGFDYLYDKVGMYDTLRAVTTDCCPSAPSLISGNASTTYATTCSISSKTMTSGRIASDFFASEGEKAIPALIISALFSYNPVMIYFGQEFGERGMDKEGFSGKDGRTTIFDYWCVDTVRRGFYDRKALTTKEKKLEAQYKQILNIATTEKSIAEGQSYDLMYVNPHLGGKQFAFLRGNDMLIAVNFAGTDTDTEITIPSHAFEFLGIKEGNITANDLLTNKEQKITLAKDTAIKVSIPAYGGIILKW